MKSLGEAQLHVLSVVRDAGSRAVLEEIIRDEGDLHVVVESVEAAVANATDQRVDVAFVDLAVEDGAALALCHHLPTLHPAVVVYVLVPPSSLDLGASALSLGAAGTLVSPPTGEGVYRLLAAAKEESSRAARLRSFETSLGRELARVDTYERMVRSARGATQSEAVKAIVEGASRMSGATGVALYATSRAANAARVRLGAVGSALDFPTSADAAALERLAQARPTRVIPLVMPAGELGVLVLDQPPTLADEDVEKVADLGALMLSLVDRSGQGDEPVRVYAPRHFREVGERLLTLASRHDRRASVLAIALPSRDRGSFSQEIVLEISNLVRGSDVICSLEHTDILLLLPETSGLGAHTCRRRILARLGGGDRRTGSTASGERPHEPKGREVLPFSIGIATFPHDGASLKRLVRGARARAKDDARSPVQTLSLETMSLDGVVDALIASPMHDAGPRSPYPLDVPGSTLFALVARACREALRGGESRVTTTLQPGLGAAAAARQVTTPKVLDVRGERGCTDIEAVVVEAEHGAWVCCGRMVGERFRGVHSADPRLADVLRNRIVASGSSDAG